jgi:thiamine-phosphate diphosphorylase
VSVPVLHVVVTDRAAGRASFASEAREILAAGRARVALHLRLRRVQGGTLYDLTRELSAAAEESGSWCAVNERVDIALSAGAQAIQLGHGALPVPVVRGLVGTAIAIGASVHSAEEARLRAREGADYLIAGSVFATPTHPGMSPAGLGLIASCSREAVPVVGIGGIGAGNAARVVEEGAAGVAVVRAVWEAPDPVVAAQELIRILAAADRAGAHPVSEDG